jgi:hypothetical protein
MCYREKSNVFDIVDEVIAYDQEFDVYLIRWLVVDGSSEQKFSWQRLDDMNEECKINANAIRLSYTVLRGMMCCNPCTMSGCHLCFLRKMK